MNFIKNFLDWLIPRFITEDVVCYYNIDGELETFMAYDLWVSERDYNDYDTPDGIVQVQSFNIFGRSYFGKVVSEPMDYYDYIKEKTNV